GRIYETVLRYLPDAVEEGGQSASGRIGVSHVTAVGDDGVKQRPVHQIIGGFDDVFLAQHGIPGELQADIRWRREVYRDVQRQATLQNAIIGDDRVNGESQIAVLHIVHCQ